MIGTGGYVAPPSYNEAVDSSDQAPAEPPPPPLVLIRAAILINFSYINNYYKKITLF